MPVAIQKPRTDASVTRLSLDSVSARFSECGTICQLRRRVSEPSSVTRLCTYHALGCSLPHRKLSVSPEESQPSVNQG